MPMDLIRSNSSTLKIGKEMVLLAQQEGVFVFSSQTSFVKPGCLAMPSLCVQTSSIYANSSSAAIPASKGMPGISLISPMRRKRPSEVGIQKTTVMLLTTQLRAAKPNTPLVNCLPQSAVVL